MEAPPGGNYPAPSAPPAPTGYPPQQPFTPQNYHSGPPDYSQPSGPYSSSLTYSASQRVQPTYQSQTSLSRPSYATQNTYSAPPNPPQHADAKLTTSYSQPQGAYGRQSGAPSYLTNQTLPNNYGQALPPTSYSQPSVPINFGQPPPYTPQNSYPPQYPPAYPNPYGLQTDHCRPKVQFPPGTDPEAIMAFEQGDVDRSGFIDGDELGRVLSSGIPFSARTVHLMLHIYAAQFSNKIGPAEFAALWKALKEWKGVFERFDRDRSGRIDSQELKDALLSMGYSLSTNLLNILISKYDKTGQAKALDYDNFVECGLVVKGLTDNFKAKDLQLRGSATLEYETFLQMVLPFIVA